ncbi:hypothetical protein CRENBAI_012667 [Crenichthys baileyi]|uniref:Uncharacterized protein n=1 Tax=Crenichthys baileyi TaxID=28760 RepID=A0AAV9RFH5_9TELE
MSRRLVSHVETKTSWQFHVSPSSEPRHKHNLFTLQRKYYLPELLTVLHKSLKQFQRNFCVEHSGPPAVRLLQHIGDLPVPEQFSFVLVKENKPPS